MTSESSPSDNSSRLYRAGFDESSHLPTNRFNRQREPTVWNNCCRALARFLGKQKIHEMLGRHIDAASIWTNPEADISVAIAHFEFDIHEQISASKNSQTYLIRMLQSGRRAVLKCSDKLSRKKNARRAARTTNLRRELDIWKALYSHPNVTSLFTTFETDRYFCFVMQYVPFRSLQDLICQGISFERRTLKRIFAELASVLHTMHAVGVIHRDLTCSNILLSKGFSCLLSDFSSSVAAPSSKRRTGSLAYMAPEMVARKPYNKAIDWWSFGIVLYTVNHKSTPLHLHLEKTGVDLKEFNEEERFRFAANTTIRIDASLPMAARSLIQELLQMKPENRLGVRDSNFELLRSHPFFIGFDWRPLVAAETKIIASPQTKLYLAGNSTGSTASRSDDSSEASESAEIR